VKVFILGLDGATFDILNPLMRDNVIPNITELCSNGTSAPLRTIFPPVTAPAWLALASGLNPGKTGIFDYINKIRTESNTFAPISSSYYKERAVWDYLGNQGYKVGIFNYPTLWPPPHVNGFAVSGMGGKSGNMCYPPELEAELHEATSGYESKLNLRNPKYKRDIDLFFEDINRIIKKQASALQYLVQSKTWDFFFAVFSFTDWMGHVLWKDIDEKHSLYDSMKSPRVKNRFKETWRNIDEVIGTLLSALPHNTNFISVSDHGMGPLESVFFPNTWLERKGWLKRRRLGWKKLFVENMTLFSEGSDNKYFNWLVRFLRNKLLKIKGTIDLIDFDHSFAYSPEHNTMFGCINLTKTGKSANGFKDLLIEAIKALPKTVKGVEQVDIFLPEEIYSGQFVNLSPDILFIVNDYKCTVEIDLHKKEFRTSPSLLMRTGGHQPDGIFIASGSVFNKMKIPQASVLDICPTVLSLYDLDIPSQIDGRVITEAIKPEVLDTLKLNIRPSRETSVQQTDEMGEENLEDMKKLLKSLGYM